MSTYYANKVDAAHGFAKRNWRVIQLHSVGPDGLTCSCNKGRRCASKGKHPINTSWQNTPPLSAPDIEALWESRPKANVGIATGEPSGFWVLDIDPEHGGMEAWAEIKAGRSVPKTHAVKTGSGGWHFYFAMPDFGVTNSPAAFKGTGIDVRGTGGQVVAPPSVSDKGEYLEYSAEVAPAPDWLLDLVRPHSPVGPVVLSTDVPDRSDLPEAEQKRLDQYAAKVVKAELERLDRLEETGWDGEPWNQTTYNVSCALLEIGNSRWNSYTPSLAYTDVFTHTPRDRAGFDDATVNKCFQSAVDKVGDNARPMPEGRSEPSYDFMNGPDVRRDPRLDPSPADGASTAPAGGTPGQGPDRFFPGKPPSLDVTILADAVVDMGPIAFGRNNDWWTYKGGAWQYDPFVVTQRCVRLLGGKYRVAHKHNVLDVVRDNSPEITGEPLERFINFRNGMLDWRTGELLEHNPEYLSTVQLGAEWDESATCPTFDQWLGEVLHEDYAKLAWEMIGYLLYSGNPIQVAFMLYGTGGNGKSTLLQVIEELLGRGNFATQSLHALTTSQFSAFNLFGKTANIAGDIDGTYLESTANFKKLTGQDVYSAEKKYGDQFQFVSWAVPVFSANKIPGSADVSEGYLRRWILLHFDRTFDQPIANLSRSLSEELPGIAAKSLRYLPGVIARNGFTIVGKAAEGREMFAQTIDHVREWANSPEVLAGPGNTEPCDQAHRIYAAWANRQGVSRVSQGEFCRRLVSSGYPHVEGRRHHEGLRLDPLRQQESTADAAFYEGMGN